MRRTIAVLVVLATVASAAQARADDDWSQPCGVPQGTIRSIQTTIFKRVVNLSDGNGGIFKPNRMWSAIVDRAGTLCSVVSSASFAPSLDVWPGSRSIAIAKAGTANDFSNNGLALSTANLYQPVQPGGSLNGLNWSNPYGPRYDNLAQPAIGHTPGGIITFGGGVALYSGGQVIGGLGVSGDSSCADHAISYRMRKLAGLDGIPGGVSTGGTDNIAYIGDASGAGFQQPHCFPQDLTPAQVSTIP